jgi:hypothetical protein
MSINIDKKQIFHISVYVDVISILFCFMVFCPMGYTTAVIQTEPARTLCALSYNPIIQTILIITILYTIILVVYDDYFSKNSILRGN